MQRIFVIYQEGKPRFYSYVASFARVRAMELSKAGQDCAVVVKPEPWIRNHQNVVLIQSTGDADADATRHQKLQVTRQKIFGLFGTAMPIKVKGSRVVLGFSQSAVTIMMDQEPPKVIGSMDQRMINGVVKRHRISNLEALDAIRDLAVWIADQWDELDLTETPW